MPLDLLGDPWIPVRRLSGARDLIAPHEITARYAEDPIVAIAAPRPDFDGALHEFLIGLLATCFRPVDEDDWFDRLDAPPGPDELREAFSAVGEAFRLDGDRAFMQEFGGLEGDAVPIGALLIDAPGENTIRRNTDLFIRRGNVTCLCPACAAQALYTLQAFSPAGGAGHRTSLRGGGPLTTLVQVPARVGDDGMATAWTRLWPNVPDALRRNGPLPADRARVFPWLAPTRVSDKGGKATTPADADGLQVFWGMPRRIRLLFESADGRRCSLCGSAAELVAAAYRTRPHGTNYQGDWRHPLTPYILRKGDTALPRHPNPGGFGYRHWLGLVQADGNGRIPAECVATFRDRRQQIMPDRPARLIAFGYDMDNMKARCWYAGEMPLVSLPDPEIVPEFEAEARMLVRAADHVARLVTWAVKSALFDKPSDASGDFDRIAERFWLETEPAFWATLDEIRLALGSGADRGPVRKRWLGQLSQAAFAVFDDEAPSEALEEGGFRRIVEARRGLALGLRGRGKVGQGLFGALLLPVPEKARKTEDVA